jgi:hypothetical protein
VLARASLSLEPRRWKASWKQLRGSEPTDANREVSEPGRLISLRFAIPTYDPFQDRDNSGEDVIFHIELPTRLPI